MSTLAVDESTERVERAIAEIAAGRPVVVVDDHDRENEGDIILAASTVTPETMAFTIRYTSGLICVPASGEILDRLELPLMVTQNRDRHRTAYTITVDAATGVSTGISAADRARTAQVVADPAARPTNLTRPGHVLPLRAKDGGVLVRRGHTEAAVDLARLAGLPEAGVLAELVHDDGTLMRLPALQEFAGQHGLALISIEELAAYRRRTEPLVERLAATRLPTRHGDLTAVAYRDRVGVEHVALVAGEVPAAGTVAEQPVVARVHSECLTGDAFGSVRCDCGPQLDAALARIVAEGRGVVVYVRGHEGRGIGLAAKLAAYALQDAGRDTVDANLEQGLPADAREYSVAAQILRDLGMPTVRLLTNNPAKVTGLQAGGATVVERLPLALPPDPRHLAYLRAKRDRLGHDLPHLDLPNPDLPNPDLPNPDLPNPDLPNPDLPDPTEEHTMDHATLSAAATLEVTR